MRKLSDNYRIHIHLSYLVVYWQTNIHTYVYIDTVIQMHKHKKIWRDGRMIQWRRRQIEFAYISLTIWYNCTYIYANTWNVEAKYSNSKSSQKHKSLQIYSASLQPITHPPPVRQTTLTLFVKFCVSHLFDSIRHDLGATRMLVISFKVLKIRSTCREGNSGVEFHLSLSHRSLTRTHTLP